MSDVNDRIRDARKRAGFKSAAAAAQKLGMAVSTYASHENGQTPSPPREDVQRYAKLFRVSPGWILTGDGQIDAKRLVSLMGRIGAGGDIDPDFEQVPEGGFDEIELPISVAVDAVAFTVDGPSMKPKYEHGTIVVCSKDGRDPEDCIGAEVAVRTADNKRYLKTLHQGRKRGLYTLESFNADPIADVQLLWVGEILAVIPPRRRALALSPKQRFGER